MARQEQPSVEPEDDVLVRSWREVAGVSDEELNASRERMRAADAKARGEVGEGFQWTKLSVPGVATGRGRFLAICPAAIRFGGWRSRRRSAHEVEALELARRNHTAGRVRPDPAAGDDQAGELAGPD